MFKLTFDLWLPEMLSIAFSIVGQLDPTIMSSVEAFSFLQDEPMEFVGRLKQLPPFDLQDLYEVMKVLLPLL